MWSLRWIILCSASALNFISVWQTTVVNESITLPISGLNFNISVDWGDGPLVYTSLPVTYFYVYSGNHTIQITGQIKGFAFNGGGDMLKILELSQWGDFTIDSTSIGVFKGCSNLRLTASDQPSFEGAATLELMFQGCTSLTGPALSWNITGVTSLNWMFAGSSYNAAINFIGATALASADYMFLNNRAFNSAIALDNSSLLNSVTNMFSGAKVFNQPILFNTSQVSAFMNMFLNATSYNQPIGFSTQSATNFSGMFWYCTSFNQPINFTTSRAQSLSYLFANCFNFNSAITFSDTSNVITTESMFYFASSFNQPLNFSTVSVNNMNSMFMGASSFNQPLNFNTGKVQTMRSMFSGADMFVQDLSGWNVSSVAAMGCDSFCSYCALPTNMSCIPCSGIKRALIGSVCACLPSESLTSPDTCGGFISTWIFDTGNYSFPLEPLNAGGLRIDWGDNTSEVGVTSSRYHVYSNLTMPVTITIWGQFQLSVPLKNQNLHTFLFTISAWGGFSIAGGTGGQFAGCSNLYLLAQDQPKIFAGAWLTSMFQDCISLNSTVALSWDLSGVQYLTSMFSNCRSFNSPLNFTNTDSVTHMDHFLDFAKKFNQNLDSFNTTNVISMDYMFANTDSFNQPLNFDTRSVTTMQNMFKASAYNSPIVWDVPSLVNASYMFTYASNFNSPIKFTSCQNLTHVDNMFNAATQFNSIIQLMNATSIVSTAYMFCNAAAFNQALDFPTNNVYDMQSMFYNAQHFNMPVAFDTSNVKIFQQMFGAAINFNQPLNFRTSNGQAMSFMFDNALSFRQNLGTWSVASIGSNACESFCDYCGLPNFNLSICNPCPAGTTSYFNSSRGWRVCSCSSTELLPAPNQSQCVAIPCNTIGYTGPDGACTCADGYGSGVQYIAGQLVGCAPLSCNATGYTGPDGNCTCASGFNGRVRYVNNTDSGCSPIGQFRSAWITSSDNETVTLPFVVHSNCGNQLVTVDWGDGNNENYTTCDHISYSYLVSGEYVITIDGVVQGLSFHNRCDQLHRIDSWGAFQVDFQSAHTFDGCSNLILNTTDQPVILPGANMSCFFANTKFNQTLPFSWDMFNVVSMQGMFSGIAALGVSLFNPYTVNVNDMSQLFYNTNFNAVLQFDTSQVTNMGYMFANSNVSQSLDFLVTNKVISMLGMFIGTQFFNQRLDTLNTSSVITMQSMFANSQYNQPLFFDTVHVTDMQYMFRNATKFNSVLSFSNTINVQAMNLMFQAAKAFNSSILFDTRTVNSMTSMFHNATSFNQQHVAFDTSSATDLSYMFSGATSFNPLSLTFTNTSLVTTMDSMFVNTPFNCPLNFDTKNVVTMYNMFANTTNFQQPLMFDTRNVGDFSGMFMNSVYNKHINFNTSKAILMVSMFQGAQNFNSTLNFTSTAAVTSMSYMFAQATAYNQPLTFALSSQNLSHMFDGADAFVQNVSYRGANFSAPCDSFCKFCGILPHPGIANALGYCHPCPSDQYYFNAANVTVCNCPPGQSLLGANSNVCGPPTRAPSLAPVSPTNRVYAPTVSPSSRTPTVSPSSRTPTATVVVYSSGSNQTRVNASGVQVIIDQDPIFGLNGTVAIAIKPPNATVSPIVTINFFDGNNNEKNITGLSHPIVFVIPLVAGTVDGGRFTTFPLVDVQLLVSCAPSQQLSQPGHSS